MSSYNRLLDKPSNSEDDNDRSSFESHHDHDHPLCPNCQRQTRTRRRLTLLSTLLLPLTLLIILSLLATNLTQTYRVRQTLSQDHADVTYKFHGENRDFMSLDHKYDYLWTPDNDGRGQISLPLYPGGPEAPGVIAMFHQLHCLAGIRKALQRAKAGEEIGMDWRDHPHWPHCFHYLRQGIQCAADGTVERQRARNGSIDRSLFIDGQWDVRRCGNRERLVRLADEHVLEHWDGPDPNVH